MVSNYVIVEELPNEMFLVEIHLPSGKVVESHMNLKQVEDQICPMSNPYE